MREFAYIHEEGQIPESLKDVPFLQSFQGEHLVDLLHLCRWRECDPGDVVSIEGGSGSRIYILMAGQLDVIKAGEKLTTFDKTGDVFGELAALGDEMRSATVQASTKTFLLAMDQKFLHDVKPRDENPAFYAAFYEFLARITAQRLRATSIELSRMERDLHDAHEELAKLKKG